MPKKIKYETNIEPYLDRIPKWRRDGLTEAQIAKKLGVSNTTLKEYKKIYVELFEALRSGKEELIESLEDSLYKRAMGYNYEERKEVQSEDGYSREITFKHMAPDVAALIFSLTNLNPVKWKKDKTRDLLDREKFEFEKSKDIVPVKSETSKIDDEIANMTADEIKTLLGVKDDSNK